MNSPSLKKLLVIMGKEPVPGRVKTRLLPGLTGSQAADLYRCLLEDRIEEMRQARGIEVALAYDPPEARPVFEALTGGGVTLVAQAGGELGGRLVSIFRDSFAAGYRMVAIVDSDTPGLAREAVMDSFEALEEGAADIVFGPSEDGGYYLVGMSKEHPELFAGIPWSTGGVLEASLIKAEQAGARTHLLSPQQDIDTFEDLQVFAEGCRGNQAAAGAAGSLTRAFIEKLKLAEEV